MKVRAMNYESYDLKSAAQSLYKTAPFLWPVLIIGGICSGLFIPFVCSTQLGDFALPLAAFFGTIGFLVGYASAVVSVSVLKIYALKGLRVAEADEKARSADLPQHDTTRIIAVW